MYMYHYEGRDYFFGEGAKAALLLAPKHGELTLDDSGTPDGYFPNKGYSGNDYFIVQVVKDSVMVKVHYFVVVDYSGELEYIDCPEQPKRSDSRWKISQPSADGSNDSVSWLRTTSLFALLSGASNALSGFANLSGGALGQATGEGANAAITLDTNAAGHGWFIDYTPYLSEEYLPTSNPLEWIAKPGSEAEGKMDLMTVLLHEYGHALGIEHTAYSHDLMASTLLPGVRRLPSGEEWQALLAQLNGTQASSKDPSTPPGTPLPVGMGLAALMASRQRRSALTQLETVANPTLENPRFEAGPGWSTAGNVTFAASAATLNETATTQTRLNQAFVLGPSDRFLSFKLSDIALDGVDNAPDDAFEVALIDTNTGLSLLGGTGLSKSDAILNLQADGSEYKASGVSVINNADGSRTVLVDLAGIAAGTVVNLSFDLIGFGRGAAATSSRVTVKDLRLGMPQEAHDDTVSTEEDVPQDLDVAGNDLGADQPGVVPVLVAGPAHGTLELIAEGRFRYTPAADWSGEDSFTYQLSDGRLDSNIATVTLTVTPVNDAPVAADAQLTLVEDGVQRIDLVALAGDVEGDALTAAIVAGPQHGQVVANADGSFSYTPQADWFGEDSFSYRVSDGTLDSNVAIVRFTVTPVNDVPAIAPRSVTLNEDIPVTVDLLQGAGDVDGDILTVAITTAPHHGTLNQNADGTWTYVPAADWSGMDVVEYEVSDGTVAVPTRLTLVVNAVNDAPVAADDAATLAEDGEARIVVLANDHDVEGDSLAVQVVAGPRRGRLELGADGSFLYIPDADFNGEDHFTYRVSDGRLDSNIATVTLTVAPVNDVPVVSPVVAVLLEDGQVVLDLLAHASDVDGDPLTLSVGQPGYGQVVRSADGVWIYRPAADYYGEDGFAFTVSDGQETVESRVRLTITAVNDAPQARSDAAMLDEDGRITLALVSNDSDVESDALTLAIRNQPAHGRLILNPDNTVIYVPTTDWSGEDTFTYVVSDGELDSNLATVRLTVTPVADAPILVLTDRAGQSREVFRTGWETVSNKNSTSTLVQRKELEGWTLTVSPAPSSGGSNGFEIWSSGDKMMDAGHKLRTASAMADNGNNWFELNNSGGSRHQNLGVERTVETVAGATYILSLDLAGRLGYNADYSRIGLYVDGVRIGGDQSASPDTVLDWQTRTFQFTGKGGQQTIRIVSEATEAEKNGRGMMLDDIVLVETLPANTGWEDNTIGLSAISAALKDGDGSETLSLFIDAVPVGASLSDGMHSFTATMGNTLADVTGWNLGQLSISPPKDYNGSFTLKVTAHSIEQANRVIASSTAEITVTFLPVNDAPVAKGASFTLPQDGSVLIDFAALIEDVDGNALTLTMTNPRYGSLSRNADGRYVYRPSRGYTGNDSFNFSVSDGRLTGTATIHLTVLTSSEALQAASLRLHAEPMRAPDAPADDRAYIVINQGKDRSATTPTVDWNGRAVGLEHVSDEDWIVERFVGRDKDERSLAEITGLACRAERI